MSTNIQQSTWAADLHPPCWYWLLPLALPLAVVLFILYQSTQVLPRLMVVPSFSLTDQAGQRLTSEDLRGDLVIYAFAQPNCSVPCRAAGDTLQQLRQALGDSAVDGIPLHFVTISEGQTPYVQAADPKLWHVINTESEQFNTLFASNSVQNGSSPLYALADGWGIVRAFYTTTAPDLNRIESDLHSVAREARNAGGVNRYAYEAVHLFLCHNNIVGTP